jgi:RNA polymerase sigma-70 factor (ECF subfamily)
MNTVSRPVATASEFKALPSGTAQTVTRVLEGDTEAFRTLVEAHEGAVFGLCRRLLLGDAAEAEDVTQETFLRAFKYLSRLEDPGRFQPWLYQIARSLCRDKRRQWVVEDRALAVRGELLRRRQISCAGAGPTSDVAAALEDLPADEHELLHLRYFEGLSYEEVSSRLNLSKSQVDHLIRKARARLERRLAVRNCVERG